MKPQIVAEDFRGRHNQNLGTSRDRLIRGHTYRDLSTICIVPTRGAIPAKVVQSWMGLMAPMNQKFARLFAVGMEIGEAYSTTIDSIINDPDLSNWKFILTLEDDNMPPPDGLTRLFEGIDQFDIIGGLYWTKGEAGQPMIFGDPRTPPINFIPQLPLEDQLQPCVGLGMGFTLFKMAIFKDARVPRPFFKTIQDYSPEHGIRWTTQDMHFFVNIYNLGYKVAVDTRIKIGHYDQEKDIIW
jgi:hypothetical protein